MQLRPAAVTPRIYLLNFLKDESTCPYLCHRAPEPGAGVGSHADTIVILPIPGPLSHSRALCAPMNQILRFYPSNSKPYFKCKYSVCTMCSLAFVSYLPTHTEISFLYVSERSGWKKEFTKSLCLH